MIFRVQAAVENCRICQLCSSFISKYVVKYVKETCETVHSIPKETCDKVTRCHSVSSKNKQPVFGGKTRT